MNAHAKIVPMRTPAMSVATDPGVLREIAERIKNATVQADDYLVRIACDFAEAKAVCKRAGMTFKAWVERETDYSYGLANKLARAGQSEDPVEAIAEMRRKTAARMRKSREEVASRDATMEASSPVGHPPSIDVLTKQLVDAISLAQDSIPLETLQDYVEQIVNALPGGLHGLLDRCAVRVPLFDNKKTRSRK